MKFSLISATSIFALVTAAAGPGHAAELMSAPGQMNIYDLVDDGMTSADGGDSTVTKQDPLVSAVLALRAATIGWQTLTFTGPADASAAGNVSPRVPLGAAPGTRPDDDFATPISGAWQWNALQKARAIGFARIAPLIGTIGDGPAANEKAGGTVFVAEGSRPGFSDGGNGEDGVRSSSVAVAFAPSSTSTATITVAGAGNFRQRGGTGFSVAAANSLQAAPPVSEKAPQAVVLTKMGQPTPGYNYTPATSATRGNAVEASFSDAITATGNFAQLYSPVTTARIQTSDLQSGRAANGKIQTSELLTGRGQPGNGKVETSQLQPNRGLPGAATNGNVQTSELRSGQARPEQLQTSDVAATYSRLIDLTQPIEGKVSGTQVDGTRTFLSASVSANPSGTAALYMANVVNAAPTVPTGQTVEAFQVGPRPGSRARGSSGTSVSDPLGDKIMASAGPLNNSLALP